MINEDLFKEMKVPEENRKKIQKLHKKRDKILKEAEKIDDDINIFQGNVKERNISIQNLIKLNLKWYKNEKDLQDLWGFDDNDDFIMFWTFPGCSCENQINKYGKGNFNFNSKCYYHNPENQEKIQEFRKERRNKINKNLLLKLQKEKILEQKIKQKDEIIKNIERQIIIKQQQKIKQEKGLNNNNGDINFGY